MKHSLYIIYILLSELLLVPAFTVEAAKRTTDDNRTPIRITWQGAEVGEDDSVSIRLLFVLDDIRVPSSRSLILQPRLVGEGQLLSLPAVVVSGRRRAHYDLRARTVDPATRLPGDNCYRQLVSPKKYQRYEIPYIVRIPYTTWMRNAGLSLRQISRDCCHSKVLADDLLTADLALIPPCLKEVDSQSDRARAAYNRYNKEIRFLIPDDEPARLRTETSVAYVDYRQGSAQIDPAFGSNPDKLSFADSLFLRLRSVGPVAFRQVMVTGYASPEGNYKDNEQLARRRAEQCRNYIAGKYLPDGCPLICNSVAEDWDELREMVSESDKPWREAVCFVIDNYGIFEGRERYLMQLDGGKVYDELLRDYFPRLRRVELRVTYEMPPVTDARAARLLYTHPESLSLVEMYRIARYYPPATEQHREVYVIAAETYPENIVAQINAAAASLLLGDAETARRYLDRDDVKADPRAAINRGVMLELIIEEEGVL